MWHFSDTTRGCSVYWEAESSEGTTESLRLGTTESLRVGTTESFKLGGRRKLTLRATESLHLRILESLRLGTAKSLLLGTMENLCLWTTESIRLGTTESLRGWELANAEGATVPGSILASDAMQSEGRQMKQCWKNYMKKKNPKNPTTLGYQIKFTLSDNWWKCIYPFSLFFLYMSLKWMSRTDFQFAF